jgi:hypothetical protein
MDNAEPIRSAQARKLSADLLHSGETVISSIPIEIVSGGGTSREWFGSFEVPQNASVSMGHYHLCHPGASGHSTPVFLERIVNGKAFFVGLGPQLPPPVC